MPKGKTARVVVFVIVVLALITLAYFYMLNYLQEELHIGVG
jgi:Tfp pilus assembly protein PilO